MWYYGGGDKTCLAVSKDGIRWEKPEFDVVPGTNIVMKHARRDSSTVWLDLDDPDPKRRYKALVFAKVSPGRGLDLRVSPDGIHWSKPIAHSKNIGDRTTFFYNPFRKVWVFSLRVGMGKFRRPRSRVYREHPDVVAGLDWREKEGLYEQHADLFPWTASDRLDPRHPDPRYADERPQLYNLDAAAYESVLLGLFSICQGPDNEECKRRGIPNGIRSSSVSAATGSIGPPRPAAVSVGQSRRRGVELGQRPVGRRRLPDCRRRTLLLRPAAALRRPKADARQPAWQRCVATVSPRWTPRRHPVP